MNSLFFVTEKRDGRIKGRTVADGSKQRLWINKEDVSGPTVTVESVTVSAIIDAKEQREVTVLDIPNAFIQTNNEKLKSHHKTHYVLVEIDPDSHGPYLTKENEVSALHLEILKALCGMMVSSLLFCRKLRKDLEQLGFKVNPCDICLANKMINGEQFTVLWHVDDLKISHKDKKVVDQFIQWAIKKHEDSEITKLKPSRGMVHDHLGITLDYSEK